MIRAIWEYIRERKWRYVKIAMVLILYDYTLLIPTQVIQRLVDHLSQQTLTQSNFVWDMVLLVGSAILNYLTAFYWQLRLFQSSVHFKATLQGQAFRKLVAMRRPFFEKFRSGDLLTRFTTDVDGMADMAGYGMMVLLFGGGLFAFIIPTMFFISWQLTLISFIPVMLCKSHLYVSEPLVCLSIPFFANIGFTNLEMTKTTKSIITITKVVIVGSITNIVTEIAIATIISVNIPNTLVNSEYALVTSDCITLRISPDSTLRKNS